MKSSEGAAEFELARGRLTGLAYRMLGTLSEAEDVVQDAFLRVSTADTSQVADIVGYLHTTVARLCLDRLKSARSRREVYPGTWLPEPIVDHDKLAAEHAVETAHDLSFALLMTMERLSPPERTAFLLHDVFGQDYSAVAQVLQRSEASCRKLAERARAQVHEGAPRFDTKPEDEQRLLQAFLVASSTGDVAGLMQLLAADAVLYTDGGGKRRAAHNPVLGAERIVRFFVGVLKHQHFDPPQSVSLRRVNGLPGVVFNYKNGDMGAAAIEIRGDRLVRLYIITNPDKTRHLRTEN